MKSAITRGPVALAWFLTVGLLLAPHAFAAPERLPLEVDGHPLALWTESPKTPQATLLLVHGRTWSSLPNFDLAVSGKNRSVFDAFVRKGYAVYALDLRGYGASARDETGWLTPARAVADVRAALDHIAARHPRIAQRPALLGYSRGAQIAVVLAQSDSRAAAALVLFGFPPGVRNTSTPAVDKPPRAPTTAAAAAEDFITPGAASRTVIEAYVSAALAADPVRVDWRDENQLAFEPAKIATPTLMIYGVNDPFRNAASAAFFDALAARDRAYVVLPDSDHAAHVENSASAWVHAIDGFLQSPRAKE
ncbi:MAG: alpha/beta fold hydrolase [Steroidobacteraceae bacterium]|nr:alpha/beta fold hydrolase [Steroidobacteraceae bacterium]